MSKDDYIKMKTILRMKKSMGNNVNKYYIILYII